MSIKVMTLVWDRYPGSGSDLLAALALADWCNDSGGDLYPSIASVAIKIRASESQARRILHRMIDDGWLEVVGNASGGAPGSTRRYRLNVARLNATRPVDRAGASDTPTGSADATPSTHARGGMDARDGLHPCAETGSTGDTQTVIKATVSEPSKARRRASAHDPSALTPPDWVPRDAWDRWLESRAKAKRWMTDGAVALALSSLRRLEAEGSSMVEVLDQSTLSGWTGLFAVKHPRVAGAGVRDHHAFAEAFARGDHLGEVP